MAAAEVAILAMLAAGVLVFAMAFRMLRRLLSGGSTTERRKRAFAKIGYRRIGPGRWTRPITGMSLVYEQAAGGGRWRMELPRYRTFNVRVRERAGGGMKAFGRGTFLVQHEAMDARFVVASDHPADTLELLSDPSVQSRLLELPFVDLDIRADELELADPQGHIVAGLRGDVLEAHQRVAALVLALLRRLYEGSSSVILER